MRKQIRRFTGITILIMLTVLVFAGCNMLLTDPSSASSDGEPVILTVSAGTMSARTVTVQEDDIDIASYKLTAVQGETTRTETWADLANAQITLETGTWTFILQAFSGADASGDLLLEGSLEKTIEASGELAFALSPLATGTGDVEVTITWPETITAVDSVTYTLGGTAGTEGVLSGPESGVYSYTVTETGVGAASAGTLLVVKLKDSGGTALVTVSELVRVYDKLTSRKTIALAAADFNSAPEAPSNLTATREAGSTTINLTWADNSANEAVFPIRYSDDGGSTWTELTMAEGSTVSFDDTDVPRGTTRSYRIWAVNDYGSSGSSTSDAITVPNLHTITYDANGSTEGSVPEDTAQYEAGVATITAANISGSVVQIPAAGTAEAFKFGGWNTQADGNGTTYQPGDTFTITADTTLYVYWDALDVGDIGPAGGYIFYDKGSFTDDWRYLEAAPENISNQKKWGTYDYTVSGADGTAIGTGAQNTLDIIADDTMTDNAAHACNSYESGGYSDWFLPSSDELNAMYTNLYLDGLGDWDFSESSYCWSSSEVDSMKGYRRRLDNGSSEEWSKNGYNPVRPARAF
ncbi:InlB B-repeat-containing protein [Sediminispirochaeta bajacaliforniensis]|uniref:InlB B-repeat-containing protein n=1 Tax=Sediminispirochaeta bajacaliforniensis TaxID=148 RepID=UPI00035E98A9|nr:InlB B-repeat-containing protein [Sediminispirochaeta bajacaliforniensis]